MSITTDVLMSSINLAMCKKNIINDPSTYDQFEKTCTNMFSTSVRPTQSYNNPLIYCPEDKDGIQMRAVADEHGNITCTSGEDACIPKVNVFSANRDVDPTIAQCKAPCKPRSFYLNGQPNIPVRNQEDCLQECRENSNCTGYTFYQDHEKGPRCMMYTVKDSDYAKYTPINPIIEQTTELVLPLDTETNGFPCKSQFNSYKQTGNVSGVDSCINNIGAGNPNPDDVKLKLIDAVKDLTCQYAACTTEYKKEGGKMDLFKHANTLGGEISWYLNNSDYKDYLKPLYILSGIIVFWMFARFFLYKIIGGFGGKNRYNIFNAFFGSSSISSILSFILPSLATALAVVVPLSIGKFAPAFYTMIVCATILILFLAIINIILTVKGFSNWRMPGGFQQIFMIIIILVSLAGAVYFLYESIKDRDYGASPIESEAPFITIPKVGNYGYIALMVTGGVGLIALLVIIIELFSSLKKSQYSGTDMSVKSNTKGVGIIASALYGIVGGINMLLAVFAPFLLLTLAIFERIFGAIVTKASKKEGFLKNLMINIGTAIHGASVATKSRKSGGDVEDQYLKIGQEFFGGGPSNGWAPFGTTLLNIILGMMTNYNYVLSRTSIDESGTPTQHKKAEMPSNIRVLDKEMWVVWSRDSSLQTKVKANSIWLAERNNRSPPT